MRRILFAALFLTLVWGSCVEKKPEGTGLPAPQVGISSDSATAGKSKKDLPAVDIELPESLAAGESPAGGTVPPRTDTIQQVPVSSSPPAPSYVPEKKTQKLELLDLGDGKKKQSGQSEKKKSSSSRTSPPVQRPAEYSAPTTVTRSTQSAPVTAVQEGSVLTAGQLNSWQTLIRNATDKTAVAKEVPKIIPRKKPTLACSDCAQALLFSYKYLVFHNDEANAAKWYNKSKRFDCADRSALLAVLIATDAGFAEFVTK